MALAVGESIRVPPAAGWACAGSNRAHRDRPRIVLDGIWYCLACGRRLRYNWKHLTNGEAGGRWRMVWHHVGAWGTYGGC